MPLENYNPISLLKQGISDDSEIQNVIQWKLANLRQGNGGVGKHNGALENKKMNVG